MSASMTLNVHLNSANECQCTSVRGQDDRTRRDETVQMSTRRATTTNDSIAESTEKKQVLACLQHKLHTKRVSLN